MVWEGKTLMFKKLVKALSVFFATGFFKIKYRFRVTGAENIPEGSTLICANHRCASDPILLYMAVPKRYIYYYAKQALTKNKLMKWYMSDVLGVKPVSHSAADLGAIKWGVTKLKSGELVGIFPEGTRNRTDAPLLEFQHGASVIAHMAKAPVVTATINCSRKWFSKCEIVFSEPLDLTDLYKERLTDDIKNKITEKIYENISKSLKK